jgi:hypothetical protein
MKSAGDYIIRCQNVRANNTGQPPPHDRSATSVGYVLYSPDIFYDLKDFFYLLVMEL